MNKNIPYLNKLVGEVRRFEYRIAAKINTALHKCSRRGQRMVFVVLGVTMTGVCVYQVIYALQTPLKSQPTAAISMPHDMRADTTQARLDPRVMGVLVPHDSKANDTLWVAASIHQRFFIGNRVRWLEVSLDSLRAFRQTHQYRPIH